MRKSNAEMLTELIPLAGKIVVDVGCGNGFLVRLMTRQGAHVTGLESSPGQLRRARDIAPEGDEIYIPGQAQYLPMGDGSTDLVVFANSLHHVPAADMPLALSEAARVLRPGGMLYVSEPIAEGPFFQITRLIDDETDVRAQALAALQNEAPGLRLRQEREVFYTSTVRHADYASFQDRMTAIDESRARKVAEQDAALRAAFAAHGQQTDQGWTFDQPMRVNLLIKQ